MSDKSSEEFAILLTDVAGGPKINHYHHQSRLRSLDGNLRRCRTMTAVKVDRLTHKSILVDVNGESYRLKETRAQLKNNKL